MASWRATRAFEQDTNANRLASLSAGQFKRIATVVRCAWRNGGRWQLVAVLGAWASHCASGQQDAAAYRRLVSQRRRDGQSFASLEISLLSAERRRLTESYLRIWLSPVRRHERRCKVACSLLMDWGERAGKTGSIRRVWCLWRTATERSRSDLNVSASMRSRIIAAECVSRAVSSSQVCMWLVASLGTWLRWHDRQRYCFQRRRASHNAFAIDRQFLMRQGFHGWSLHRYLRHFELQIEENDKARCLQLCLRHWSHFHRQMLWQHRLENVKQRGEFVMDAALICRSWSEVTFLVRVALGVWRSHLRCRRSFRAALVATPGLAVARVLLHAWCRTAHADQLTQLVAERNVSDRLRKLQRCTALMLLIRLAVHKEVLGLQACWAGWHQAAILNGREAKRRLSYSLHCSVLGGPISSPSCSLNGVSDVGHADSQVIVPSPHQPMDDNVAELCRYMAEGDATSVETAPKTVKVTGDADVMAGAMAARKTKRRNSGSVTRSGSEDSSHVATAASPKPTGRLRAAAARVATSSKQMPSGSIVSVASPVKRMPLARSVGGA